MHAAPKQRAERCRAFQIASFARANDKADANGPMLYGEINSRHYMMKWQAVLFRKRFFRLCFEFWGACLAAARLSCTELREVSWISIARIYGEASVPIFMVY